MDLRPGDRAPEVTPAALTWSPPEPAAEPDEHRAASLHGATVVGEAARARLAIRIGIWLGDGGVVHKARWRAADDAGLRLRAAAEAACALLEARGARVPDAAALREAGAAAEGAEMVAAAVEAALLTAAA